MSYRKHFSKVADDVEMKAWLEGDSGSVDVDVWGVKKWRLIILLPKM
jgi:hypothetical protein